MKSSTGTNQAIMKGVLSRFTFYFYLSCEPYLLICVWTICPKLIMPGGEIVNPLHSVTAWHNIWHQTYSLSPSLSLYLSLSLTLCSFCFCASVPVKKLLTSHSGWGWIKISHRVCTNMQRAHFDRCHQRTSIWITRQPAIFEFRQNGINTWLRSKQQHNNNMKAKATGSR